MSPVDPRVPAATALAAACGLGIALRAWRLASRVLARTSLSPPQPKWGTCSSRAFGSEAARDDEQVLPTISRAGTQVALPGPASRVVPGTEGASAPTGIDQALIVAQQRSLPVEAGRLVAELEAYLRPRALQLAGMPPAFTANLLSAFLPAAPPLRRSGRSP